MHWNLCHWLVISVMSIIQFIFNALEKDLCSRNQGFSLVRFVVDPVTRFHWYMRVAEGASKCIFLKPLYFIFKYLYLSLSLKLGFSIPLFTLEPGVYIPHWGTIVINSRATVGSGSVINVNVVIGRHPSSKDLVPRIGRNVYIGPGAVISGRIVIGDGAVIGANSVVLKNVDSNTRVFGNI